jgi:phosphohistidine phosphatase
MRHLLVMRHAKSAWPQVADHERPLAGRGRRAAPRMGGWLREERLFPDLVVCSTARRARETWELAAGTLGTAPPVAYEDRLYGATGQELLAVARQTPPPVKVLLLVGHDPGVLELTLLLGRPAVTSTDERLLARAETKFPTGAVAVLECSRDWARLNEAGAHLISFVVPRELPRHEGP